MPLALLYNTAGEVYIIHHDNNGGPSDTREMYRLVYAGNILLHPLQG